MKRHPTPVFVPGKSHEKRGLAGSSPWCHEELDTTNEACTHTQQSKTHYFLKILVDLTINNLFKIIRPTMQRLCMLVYVFYVKHDQQFYQYCTINSKVAMRENLKILITKKKVILCTHVYACLYISEMNDSNLKGTKGKNYNYFVISRYTTYEVTQCYLEMDLDYLYIYIANSRAAT